MASHGPNHPLLDHARPAEPVASRPGSGAASVAARITAPVQSQRHVRCYHCGSEFPIPAKALTLSCPSCFKRVGLQDIYVRKTAHAAKVETCGVIFIEKKGWLSATCIRAGEGIEIQGRVDGNVVSDGPVVVGPRAVVRGSLRAPRVVIDPGATLVCMLRIGEC